MKYPENLRYTEEHEWVRLEEDGTAYVGVTDYAQSELGDVVYVDITELDEDLDKNDVFGTVEAVKTVSDLYMPVAGKVIAMNEALEDDPEKVNQDPYGEGWMIKIQVANPADVEELLDAAAYQETL